MAVQINDCVVGKLASYPGSTYNEKYQQFVQDIEGALQNASDLDGAIRNWLTANGFDSGSIPDDTLLLLQDRGHGGSLADALLDFWCGEDTVETLPFTDPPPSDDSGVTDEGSGTYSNTASLEGFLEFDFLVYPGQTCVVSFDIDTLIAVGCTVSFITVEASTEFTSSTLSSVGTNTVSHVAVNQITKVRIDFPLLAALTISAISIKKVL